ncbi:MAG: hypothetical protein H7A46_07270 [Verrucomicrobiales bacterium]|nr:hypothetical protein [Verrucomicrobiales bacterium]
MKTPWDDPELEAELRRLQPRRPSQMLAARVEQAVAAERRARRWRSGWLVLAAAAVLTAVLVPLTPGPSAPHPAELVDPRADGSPDPKVATAHSDGVRQGADEPSHPGETTLTRDTAFAGYTRLGEANYLYAAEDDGILFASSTTPLRRIRYQYLDTTDWRDEQAQAVVRVVVPREDVVLVPLHVY